MENFADKHNQLTLTPSPDPDAFLRRRWRWRFRYFAAAILLAGAMFLRWWLGGATSPLGRQCLFLLLLTAGVLYLMASATALGHLWFWGRNKTRFEFGGTRMRIYGNSSRIIPYASVAGVLLAYQNKPFHTWMGLHITLDGEKDPLIIQGGYPMLHRAAEEIRERSRHDGNNRDLGDDASDRAHRIRQKRKALNGERFIALLVLAIFGLGLFMLENDERERADILARGIIAQGTVTGEQRGLYGLNYAFQDGNGDWQSGSGIVWDDPAVRTAIPVAYLPEDPAKNTPVRGSKFIHVLSRALLVLLVCMLGFAVPALSGYKPILAGGRFRLIRWNELAEDFIEKAPDR